MPPPFITPAGVTPLGASFVNYSSIPSGVTTIVTPATNANGLIIRTAFLVPAGVTNVSLFADTAAPSGFSDTTKRALFFNWNADHSNIFLPFPVLLDSGLGVYIASSATGDRFCMTYDLL